MKNEEQFENTIRVALRKEVEPLEASCDALRRIKEKISQGKCTAKTGLRQKLAHYIYVLNFHKPAAALFCILIFAGLILFFNEPARVLAEEGIQRVISMIYVVVKGEKGGYDTTQAPIVSSDIFQYAGEPTCLDDDELTREMGFNTKTPENLDDGYILWETMIYNIENSPQKMILKMYYQGSKRLVLMIAGSEVSLSPYDKINYIECREEFKVQDVLVKYLEVHSPIYPMIKKGDFCVYDFKQKPSGIKTSYRMIWQCKGVYYGLYGLEVSLEEFKEATVSLVKALQQNELSGTKPAIEK